MRYDDFERELRTECGLTCEKVGVIYNESDHRCWTALIGKDTTNVLVTFHVNRGDRGVKNFDILGDRRQIVEVHTSDVFELISELVPKEDIPEEGDE